MENTIFSTRYFKGQDRLAFFRNPALDQVVLRPHERLENYRVIYWPRGFFLYLMDYAVNDVRGVVLQLDVLTLVRPGTNDLVWAGLSRDGLDVWATDVVLAGADMSNQIWMRHLPVRYFRSGVELCERWLFGLKDGDEMVKEM